MKEKELVEVKVWGPYALFTRPESKVERVTYDVMTPSAARGVLEGILWRPAFSWQVREIAVLRPIKRLSMLRNEVNSVASVRSARAWQAAGGGFYAEGDRAQRHSLFLKDVSYIIKADVVLKPHAADPVAKYVEMFNRRVRKGQCHNQPYLGTRECSAFFEPLTGRRRRSNLTSTWAGCCSIWRFGLRRRVASSTFHTTRTGLVGL